MSCMEPGTLSTMDVNASAIVNEAQTAWEICIHGLCCLDGGGECRPH